MPTIQIRRPADGPDSVLVLCTWMGASSKLVDRYARRYAEALPRSSIILITSDVNAFMFRSAGQWKATLAPVIDELLAHSDKPLRAAAYSNGGVQSLVHLAETFRARTQQPLPVRTTLIDSAPGSDSLAMAHRALLSGLNPSFLPVRVLLSLLIWTGLGAYWVFGTLLKTENPIEHLRRRINNGALFAPDTERVYVYSTTDRMVDNASVESSADEAEAKGWRVRREMFVGSGHVAHAVQEPDRYWSLVRGLDQA